MEIPAKSRAKWTTRVAVTVIQLNIHTDRQQSQTKCQTGELKLVLTSLGNFEQQKNKY